MSKLPPSSLLSTIVDTNERVTYTDVMFKSGSPAGTRKVLYDVQEEEEDDDSDWSQQSSFEDEEEEKEAEGDTSRVVVSLAACSVANYVASYSSY